MSVGTPGKPMAAAAAADAAAPAAGTAGTNFPPRDPKFVGRFDELKEIHELLAKQRAVGLTQHSAPHSYGGVGKTALALAYGWAHVEDYPGGLFFLPGGAGPLVAKMAQLAEPLGLAPGANQAQTAERVRERLATGPPALLLIDDVADGSPWSAAEQAKLIPAGSCRRLVTTRQRWLGEMAMCVLARLPRDQGVRLLAEYRPDVDDQRNQSIAGEIVDWFDGLPLGLTLVGAYMAACPEVTWTSCRDTVRQAGLGQVQQLKGGRFTVPDYHKSIEKLFDALLEALHPQQRLALEYAALLPEHQVVTRWLWELLGSELCATVTTLSGREMRRPDTVLSDLIALQLLRSEAPGHRILSLHRVLRRRLHQRFDAGAYELEGAVDHLIQLANRRGLAQPPNGPKRLARAELAPLLHLAVELIPRGRLPEAARLANQLAPILHALGRDHEVVPALRAFIPKEVLKRIEPASAAVLLSNRAASLATIGNLAAARSHMRRALQIAQKHLPPDDPALAIRHSNLAGILKAQGELAGARRHIQTAIQIEQKHFGPDHVRLAIRYWWLGDIELANGNRDEAVAQYQRAYDIMTRHVPSDHPQLQTLSKVLERHRGASES